MTITKKISGDAITFELDGWLDALSSPELGAEVDAVEKASAIVLDFDKVEFMASAGLRQVVAAHRKAKELGADFALINVGTETMSVLTLTGLDKKLDIRAK